MERAGGHLASVFQHLKSHIIIIIIIIIISSSSSSSSSSSKVIPLQVWTGPEGSRRLRFPDFTTIGT
jgi:hypothetical protein